MTALSPSARTKASWLQIPDSYGTKYRRQKGGCVYCEQMMVPLCPPSVRTMMLEEIEDQTGRKLSRRRRTFHNATREHVVRACDGGTGLEDNVVLACGFCNSWRIATPPLRWREAMMTLAAEGQHPLVSAQPYNARKIADRIRELIPGWGRDAIDEAA